MEKIITVNNIPFLRVRLITSFIITTFLCFVVIFQLSNGAGGWLALHEQSLSVVIIEILPILLFFLLLFINSRNYHEEMNAAAQRQHENSIATISTILEKVKSGTYDKETDSTSETSVDKGLRDIYDKFKTDADNERHRSWANEGLAAFRETMGTHTQIKPMCEEITSKIVKYVKANQGGIFIVNENEKLDLIACYAFERKKYIRKEVLPGEGLVGQCYLERHRIYLTQVPQHYINITSGLGGANPECLLIVPLMLKDSIVGVLELAGFNTFKDYQLEFIDKAAEALAQSISMIKVNEETNRLLENSLQREKEMKNQEERMLQNLEELYVTQEDMRKINLEMEEIFKAINTLTATVELNPQGNIIKLNDRLLHTLHYEAQDLYGKPFSSFLSLEQEPSFNAIWSSLLQGKSEEKVFTFLDAHKNQRWLRTGFYPLQGKDGTERIICFINDISEIKTKEVELDTLNREMEAFRKMLIRILNEIPLKVFLKQYNGKFFVVNDAVSRFHGFDSPEGLIGKSDFDFYGHKDAAEWLEAEHKIIAEGRTEYIHEDAGQILQTVKMPFYIDPLKETGLLGFQADVTELEKLKQGVRE
jgi:PAS domain S-box-containing protein